MSLISKSYLQQNQKLHEQRKDYGANGKRHLKTVLELALVLQTHDILDYGCGKGSLANEMPIAIKQYDPAIEKFSATPEPADLVICTDVLEHVEPHCVDDVIYDLARVTKKILFCVIHLQPANKTLPDGRNAHVCLLDWGKWCQKLSKHFLLIEAQPSYSEANKMNAISLKLKARGEQKKEQKKEEKHV